LILKCDELLSNVAFDFNLRRYIKEKWAKNLYISAVAFGRTVS